MKANVFASEEMFDNMINPVQMGVDTKGRLWAAVWPTYPKWEPIKNGATKKLQDALVILPDKNRDGVIHLLPAVDHVCRQFILRRNRIFTEQDLYPRPLEPTPDGVGVGYHERGMAVDIPSGGEIPFTNVDEQFIAVYVSGCYDQVQFLTTAMIKQPGKPKGGAGLLLKLQESTVEPPGMIEVVNQKCDVVNPVQAHAMHVSRRHVFP